MNRTFLKTVVPLLAATLFACGDNTTKTDGPTSNPDMGSTCTTGMTQCGAACVNTMTDTANCGGCGKACTAGQTCTAGACGGGQPAAPTLGMQIDRMGRAGVNTALTDPFDLDGKHDQTQDAYNHAATPADWAAFAKNVNTNLALFDGVDGTCGNQVAAGQNLDTHRYDTLTNVLVDDRLYVDSSVKTCNIYLGVEASVVLSTPKDCGGRTPVENTIDETYSLLISGSTTGWTNGVTKDGEGSPNQTMFPYLGAPNNM